MTVENFPLGHLKISRGSLEECLSFVQACIQEGRKAYCIPLNLTKYMAAKEDSKLKEAVNTADLVIADGRPIKWFGRRLGYRNVHHISGIDFAEAILLRSGLSGWKIYLLGASPENLEKAVGHINRRFDGPNIAGARDGYFKPAIVPDILDDINSLHPDILFLGLGMPQKEYFIHDHFHEIDVRFCLPVGGAFDIWAQAKKRSPALIQKMGLEWLQRSLYNREKALNIFKFGFSFLREFLAVKK